MQPHFHSPPASAAQRLSILTNASRALRAVEATKRAVLPPPESDDPELLRDIRDLDSLATRIEGAIAIEGVAQDDVWMRDLVLSSAFVPSDFVIVRQLVGMDGPSAPALSALESLMKRYFDGEFMPPDTFFEFRPPEA